MLSRLRHPHCVLLLGVSITSNEELLVTEYMAKVLAGGGKGEGGYFFYSLHFFQVDGGRQGSLVRR